MAVSKKDNCGVILAIYSLHKARVLLLTGQDPWRRYPQEAESKQKPHA